MGSHRPLKQALHKMVERKNDPINLGRIRKTTAKVSNELSSFETYFREAIGKIKVDATSSAVAAENEIRQLKQAIEALHARLQIRDIDLRRAEETARNRDVADATRESLSGENRALQDQLAETKRVLQEKDSEITRLKNQLQLVTMPNNGHSGYGECEAPNGSPEATAAAMDGAGKSDSIDEVRACRQPTLKDSGENRSNVIPRILSRKFFDAAEKELTEILGFLGPLLIRYDVEALGESVGNFPRARVAELIELLSKDIPGEAERARFREKLRSEVERL